MSCIEAKVFKTLISIKRSIQLFVEKETLLPLRIDLQSVWPQILNFRTNNT